MRKFSEHNNFYFWTHLKSDIPCDGNWNCSTLFGSEIEAEGRGACPAQWLRHCIDFFKDRC